jgi:hypothetical protein
MEVRRQQDSVGYSGVAVGTAITDRPPHRPVLAALPHTVLTSEVSVEAYVWIGV